MGKDNKLDTDNCRKCGAKNPPENEYCASCGAVLLVSTSQMKAQPKPVVPLVHRFEKRWLVTSIFVFFGVWVMSLVAFFVFANLFFDASLADIKFGETDLHASWMPVLAPALAVAMLMYLGAGMLISQLATDSKTLETVFGALIVSVLVGSSGSMVSSDFLLASVLFGIPGVMAAGFGARLGGKKFKRSM